MLIAFPRRQLPSIHTQNAQQTRRATWPSSTSLTITPCSAAHSGGSSCRRGRGAELAARSARGAWVTHRYAATDAGCCWHSVQSRCVEGCCVRGESGGAVADGARRAAKGIAWQQCAGYAREQAGG